MVAATTTAGTPWLYIVLPSATLFFTFLMAAVAFYPIYRQHRKDQKARVLHDRRLAAAADVVLGCAPDPNTGFGGSKGLISDVPSILAAVGKMNGSGKTLVELCEETAAGTRQLTDRFDKHVSDDENGFKSLNAAISRQHDVDPEHS